MEDKGVLEDKGILVGAARDARFDMSSKSEDKTSAGRKQITRVDLEQALAEVVKASHPACEGFVGVIVEKIVPASSGAANWIVKGVKYGKADRERCAAALSSCVNERQLEFELEDG